MPSHAQSGAEPSFVLAANNAVYSHMPGPLLLLFWVSAPPDLHFLRRFSGKLKQGDLSLATPST
jgi:hypothetical protein